MQSGAQHGMPRWTRDPDMLDKGLITGRSAYEKATKQRFEQFKDIG